MRTPRAKSAPEFSLIDTFFSEATRHINDPNIMVDIGDDAAVVAVPEGHELVVTTDTLVSGVHFFPDMPPHALGHKALAVNLSDLAAMGAAARWLSLAITLPDINTSWLQDFMAGFTALATAEHCRLIGGDTTQGPLSITITAHGLVPTGNAIRRDGACAGEYLWVTGPLGEPSYCLEALYAGQAVSPSNRLYYPQPRLQFMQAARELISAAVDISDGLAGDLGHLLERSGLGSDSGRSMGASLQLDALWQASQHAFSAISPSHLFGGDEYEICFSCASQHTPALQSIAQEHGINLLHIGYTTAENPLDITLNNQLYNLPDKPSYSHFST